MREEIGRTPLALSQTVATEPETNLDQESRERMERRRIEPLCLLFIPRECPFFLLFSYSSLPPRFVAPIINISPSSCLTARSFAHRCRRCFFLVLFFFFLAHHPRPAHPVTYTVPIINSTFVGRFSLYFHHIVIPSASPCGNVLRIFMRE